MLQRRHPAGIRGGVSIQHSRPWLRRPDRGWTQARLPGSEDMARIALRVTMIMRREGDTWKVAHRHADPITTPRPISTAVDTSATSD